MNIMDWGMGMARIRSIKPEFWTDPVVDELSNDAALFFISLWNFASDQGVVENNSRGLSLLAPRFRPQVIQHLLSSLWKAGLVARSRDAQLWLITGWAHQKIDKPRAGKWNPKEIEWVSYADSSKEREDAPKARRKDRIGEDRRGSERIVAQGSDGPAAPVALPVETKPKEESLTSLCWKAYAGAYARRYGEAPVWNAKMAGQLKQFTARVPASEAPEVAAFFVSHNDSYYVKSMHAVGLLLRDAEKLRTEWVTGARMLSSQAREIERRQHNSDSWDEAARILNERRKAASGGQS